MAILKDLIVLGGTNSIGPVQSPEFIENNVSLEDKYITSASVGNGVLTIGTGSTPSFGTFSANQTGNTNITLHKIAQTGNYSDLTGVPSVPQNIVDLSDVKATSANTSTNDVLSYYGSGWSGRTPIWVEQIDYAEEISYSALYDLYSNNDLTPYKLYRITDYRTRTKYDGYAGSSYPYVSKENRFDLIVMATSTDSFDCIAKAAFHSGDEYFDKRYVDISKWIIWYDINNNTDLYSWANANGTGVIYRMIDEFGNDCPYDFKNIAFPRNFETTFGFMRQNNSTILKEYNEFYTFSLLDKDVYDATLIPNQTVIGNVVKPYFSGSTMVLGGCVFISEYFKYEAYHDILYNYVGYNSSGVTVVAPAISDKIGDNCSLIDILDDSNSVFIGNNTSNVYLPQHTNSIKIGNSCQGILFDDTHYPTDNDYFDYVRNITIDDNCSGITLSSDSSIGNTSNYIQNFYIAPFVDNAIILGRDFNCRTTIANTYNGLRSYGEDEPALPLYGSSQNGKVLSVVNGQLSWETPTTVYTGNTAPLASLGNDNDIYLQV